MHNCIWNSGPLRQAAHYFHINCTTLKYFDSAVQRTTAGISSIVNSLDKPFRQLCPIVVG